MWSTQALLKHCLNLIKHEIPCYGIFPVTQLFTSSISMRTYVTSVWNFSFSSRTTPSWMITSDGMHAWTPDMYLTYSICIVIALENLCNDRYSLLQHLKDWVKVKVSKASWFPKEYYFLEGFQALIACPFGKRNIQIRRSVRNVTNIGQEFFHRHWAQNFSHKISKAYCFSLQVMTYFTVVKKNGWCTNNITLRRVRETIVAVEKQ